MLKWGFIGIGQGGNNIVDIFAKKFPTIAINTAKQDLDLENIPIDLRIHTKINDGGGAGKDIKKGEEAIIQYKDKIKDKIEMVMRDVGYIWVVAGLGGGTGSLGLVQLIQVLMEMGKIHGIICTLPCEDEGTQEKINAFIALHQIYEAHRKSNNFRGMVLLDNEELKKYVLSKGNYSYESFWGEANGYIYQKFNSLYEYSSKAGITSFDAEDYNRMFMEKGTMIFVENEFDFNDSVSDTVLASKVKEMWENPIFLTGEKKNATGTALILERPSGFDRDGKAINRLFKEIKNTINSGLFCRGVYCNKNITDLIRQKPMKIFTLLTGIPFPKEEISQLKQKAEGEINSLRDKSNDTELSFDLKDMVDFIQENNGEPKIEMLDFTVFKKEQTLTWSF